MTCVHPSCEVEQLDGLDVCSDHLTYSTFLQTVAAGSGTKNAAGARGRDAFGLRPGTVARQIVVFLNNSPRDIFTPAQIARELKHSTSTVSKEISRLRDRRDSQGNPYLVPVGSGGWRAFIDLEKLVDIEQSQVCVHAIQASMRVPLRDPLPLTAPGGAWKHDESNGQHRLTDWWGSHRLTVTLSPGGMCQVSLAASDTALTPEGFDLFLQWLDGWMTAQRIPFRVEMATMDNLELNRDGMRMSIADCRRFKMQQWRNAWAQVYQKDRDRLRAEIRLTKGRDYALRMDEAASVVDRLVRRPESIALTPSIYAPQPPEPWEMI